MKEIFVSYRHDEEAWAGRLHDALEERFDVFLDTGIAPGDQFSPEIDEAVRSCRIFIAVIGAQWLEKRNLKRLKQARDWVRREILLALGRSPEVRIVPVLVGEVEKPRTKLLPLELQPLLELQWIALRHYEWKRDVAELLSSLEASLAGRAEPGRGPGRVPALLPHLCDRTEPEDALVDRLSVLGPGARMASFVVRGHKAEGHDGFLDRLLELRTLENALGLRTTGMAVHRLDWNTEYARQGRFGTLLARSIKKRALGNPVLPDEALARFLASPGQAQLFVLQVTSADLRDCGEGLLHGLVTAWHSLLDAPRPSGGAERLVPARPLILWVNFTHEELSQTAGAMGLEEGVLELQPLIERHIRDWLELPRVRPYVQGHEAALRRIVEDERCCFERGKLHMEAFEEKVQEILEHS